MFKAGLTGGIASGKSTVADLFVELGAHLVDSDKLARLAVAKGSKVLEEIAGAFGPEVLDAGGGLDRAVMRRIIMGDPQARQRLNELVHPRVRALIDRRIGELQKKDPRGVALIDVPLLYEVGWQDFFDTVVLVYAGPGQQVRRLMQRDGIDQEEAKQALRSQMPIEEKRKKAQFTIDNTRTLDKTRKQVRAVWSALSEMAAAIPQTADG